MSRENQEESKGSKSLKSVIYICVSLIAVYLVGIFQVYPRLAGTQFLAHPLNLLYFFGLIPGLAIALALATLLYTKSTDELLWAKWLLAIPLLIVLPILGMDSSRCINWGGIDCAFIVSVLVFSCITIPLLAGYDNARGRTYKWITILFLFVTYIMAAYIIFLVTVYGGNNIVRAYSDMLLGTMF